ncbi:DUF6173 family protein [uncultured Psychrobacter sp.]|uniref:DUF6173 family protein n=1 Tax=uncultured Psychrobacter sp. TaxID=259303 RepID=UPI003459A5F7
MLDQNIINRITELHQNSNLDAVIKSANEQIRLDRNPVVEIQQSIENHVKEFESELKSDQEIMVMAASFGGSVTFYVHSIEFNEPNLIVFHGRTEDNSMIRLIQHCNQLNFLLKAARRSNVEEKRNPIGFIHSV